MKKYVTKIDTQGKVIHHWNPNQRSYMKILSDPTVNYTEDEVSKILGVPKRTLYEWRQDDNFIGEISKMVNKEVESHIHSIFGGLIKRAKEGDEKCARLIFEYLGKLKAPGSLDFSGSQNVFQIQVVEQNPHDKIASAQKPTKDISGQPSV